MTWQHKHIVKIWAVFIIKTWRKGIARPYLSGASCDTERTGCDARMFSYLIMITWLQSHVTRQFWGLQPHGCPAIPKKYLPTYHYYRCCTGLVAGSVFPLRGSVSAVGAWMLIGTFYYPAGYNRFESEWLGMLISYPVINYAQWITLCFNLTICVIRATSGTYIPRCAVVSFNSFLAAQCNHIRLFNRQIVCCCLHYKIAHVCYVIIECMVMWQCKHCTVRYLSRESC